VEDFSPVKRKMTTFINIIILFSCKKKLKPTLKNHKRKNSQKMSLKLKMMMNSQKSHKKSFLTCMINTEMGQYMLKNGWHWLDIHFYICISNGLVFKD